jgi:hypothetical protein
VTLGSGADGGWVRLTPPAEPSAGGPAARFAVAVLPAAAALIVLRRRARRRAGQSAWRYRTHGQVSAENQRIVDAHGAADSADDARSTYGDDGQPERYVSPSADTEGRASSNIASSAPQLLRARQPEGEAPSKSG